MGKAKKINVVEVAPSAASDITASSFYEACLQHRAALQADGEEMNASFEGMRTTLDFIVMSVREEAGYKDVGLAVLAQWISSEASRTHEASARLHSSAGMLLTETISTVCGIVEPNKDEVRNLDGSRIRWTQWFNRKDLELEQATMLSRFLRLETSIEFLIQDAGAEYKKWETAYEWHSKKVRSRMMKARAKANAFYGSADAYLRNLNAHYPHTICRP